MRMMMVFVLVAALSGCGDKPSNPTPAASAPRPDDPEVTCLLDEYEAELPAYERAAGEYKKGGLAKMGAVATSQGKLLPLVQSIREAASRFSPSQKLRLEPLMKRFQEAAEQMAPPKNSAGSQPARNELDGSWKYVSVGGNGKTTPADRLADMRVTFAGQQYSSTKAGKVIEQATLTADPSKQPKTIDLAITQGEFKGQTLLGIYEFAGDVLRVAFAEPGQARPAEIVNRAGLRQDIWELRRE